MKKNILTITLATLSALAFCDAALATTTVSLSPSNVNVNPGQSFNISISVNPQGVNNFVEKIELKYPADILQVNSFTLNNQWMALAQPGYDLVDNTNGVLLKSAGYPNGLSSVTSFGTVSFSAKKAGSGIVSIGGNSLSFEVNSQNAITGLPTSVTIANPTPDNSKSVNNTNIIPAAPETVKKPTAAPSIEDKDQANDTTSSVEESVVEQGISNTSLMGAIGGIMTLGTGSIAVGVLVIVLIFMIGFYVICPLVKKGNKK